MDAQTINDASNCEEGRYPYPDACVKLVMGRERDALRIPRVAGMVIVSTRDERAEGSFQVHCPDFAPHTVSSLDDVRWQVEQLRILDAQRKDGWLLRKLRKPYMVTFRWTMGVLHRRFILAWSSVDAYRGQVPEPYAGAVIPLCDLETLLARMERVKTGEEKAPYAWDYSDGGDWPRHCERVWNEAPPEDRARMQQTLNVMAAYRSSRPGDPSASETKGTTDPERSA
ncbi:TPA: hypothetical protein QDB15_000128 [Burkholderia vietnamiensis]|uniref:Uncharacterized protein n=1 Tax=Pandoraea apista TaxID=93218 RepID=A0A5E5P0X7_9BURK|nr:MULTISPECIES: hypothetical protein [Burkholderiaceae]MCA8206402.1 hypothetical protein [Burkholderia vietnamiensis]VVG70326.1 hypothetical protein PAP18089_01286 [Pandoraea apista]HDR8943200.1 hypothetical protein [Burkholderia vietnamiensis]HDR9116404.1 hypothetical protein [Burkholderia vietnamiensis]HDR9205450.1 hypothetical protein [Burkholderia vietnamiensis]